MECLQGEKRKKLFKNSHVAGRNIKQQIFVYANALYATHI